MESPLPNLTLVWMYGGTDRSERRKTLATLDYPNLEVIEPESAPSIDKLLSRMSPLSEVCVFWADDDKPVGRDFLRQMVAPLIARHEERAEMHLWSGDAVAVSKAMLESIQGREFKVSAGSFMQLALLLLDVGSAAETARSHVAFSSIERLAPLCADPVGLVC